jgi:putative endonuclease
MGKSYWVYILASQRNGTLYIGITSDLIKRIWEHKEGYSEFMKKYTVHKLVYFEKHDSSETAIKKEKLLKFWKRKWKLDPGVKHQDDDFARYCMIITVIPDLIRDPATNIKIWPTGLRVLFLSVQSHRLHDKKNV